MLQIRNFKRYTLTIAMFGVLWQIIAPVSARAQGAATVREQGLQFAGALHTPEGQDVPIEIALTPPLGLSGWHGAIIIAHEAGPFQFESVNRDADTGGFTMSLDAGGINGKWTITVVPSGEGLSGRVAADSPFPGEIHLHKVSLTRFRLKNNILAGSWHTANCKIDEKLKPQAELIFMNRDVPDLPPSEAPIRFVPTTALKGGSITFGDLVLVPFSGKGCFIDYLTGQMSCTPRASKGLTPTLHFDGKLDYKTRIIVAHITNKSEDVICTFEPTK